MTSDNLELRTYAAAMERGQPFIRLKLDIDEPIELGDFVASFTALAAEYDRFARARLPGDKADATLFVKEVRNGCVEADLVAWGLGLGGLATGAVAIAAGFNTLDEFVERLGNRLGIYKQPGGRLPDATKTELNGLLDQVAAVANAPNSRLSVAAMETINGEQETRVVIQFNTDEARDIRQRVTEHKLELDHTSRADRERVLMVFVRSDKRDAAVGKRSGELVEIQAISDRPRPLAYASALVEQEIKAEITAEDSVYKKGFWVDVNVQWRGVTPVAYAVTHLHQIIDLPDEDED